MTGFARGTVNRTPEGVQAGLSSLAAQFKVWRPDLYAFRGAAMTAIYPHSPVETLQRRILGAVIEPGGAGWDEATQAFNTFFSQTPALVAIPANVQDVVAIVEFA